ncbi:MAG: glycosyltransferase family 39 protein [Candidatus Omnitrophica bacterium]|nr:glycosyltransferase family 39 protein [Candidatus Omnitrophota bacterium]
MSSRLRVLAAAFLALIVCAVMFAEVWWWDGGALKIPLLVQGRVFPLPILSWMSLWSYLAWIARQPGAEPVPRPRRLGIIFGAHWCILLAHLSWSLTRHLPPGLSAWYVRYWQLVWAVALVGGTIGLEGWIASCRRRVRDGGVCSLEWAPPAVAFLGLWVVSILAAPGFAIGAAMAGVGLSRVVPSSLRRDLAGRAAAWWRRPAVFLITIFLAALGLRLFYAARILSSPDFLNTGSDGPIYDAIAWQLVSGEGSTSLGSLPLFAPGYVRFLALVYWLLGRNYVAVCAIQSLLGAAACLVLYDVARRLFNETTARVAAAFAALNFLLVFSAAAIGHQALDLFWTLLVVWALVRYAESPRRVGRWMLGIGMLLGWAAATREGNIAFWGAAVLWIVLGMRLIVGWRTALRHAALLSCGFLLVLFPFVHGAGSGIHARINDQWFAYPYTTPHLKFWWNPWRDPAAAWELLQTHPVLVIGRIVKAMAANASAMLLDQGYGSFDLLFLVRRSVYSAGLWAYAYGAALAGLVVMGREMLRRPQARLGWWLIITVVASRLVVHLLLESAYRHRAPLEPYLILIASAGLVRLLRPRVFR